jgi:hypothetical protein
MVVVVGAGMAGLAAAGSLRSAGRDVVVLEKSRGLGGRAATRRFDDVPVDFGAQFFTSRDAAFADEVARWVAAGVVFEWSRGFPTWSGGRLVSATDSHPRYACRSGMTTLAKFLGEGITILREHRVTRIQPMRQSWCVECENDASFDAEGVIITAPAPQAARIAGEYFSVDQRAALEAVRLAPCLALVARSPHVANTLTGVHIADGPLAWIANDSSKRASGASWIAWTLHASASFSESHLEDPPEAWQPELLSAASDILARNIPAFPVLEPLRAHRWRFAHAMNTLDGATLVAPTHAPLVLAGDAFGHGRVESAWLSGRAAARSV